MAMAAVDDHGQYLVLPRLDQLLIRIGVSTSSIRMSAFLPSSLTSLAVFNSPGRFLLPLGDQSRPRAIATPVAFAAATSAVSP